MMEGTAKAPSCLLTVEINKRFVIGWCLVKGDTQKFGRGSVHSTHVQHVFVAGLRSKLESCAKNRRKKKRQHQCLVYMF